MVMKSLKYEYFNTAIPTRGEYQVFFNEENERSHRISFIVRDLAKKTKIGIMHPIYTHAYNRENGGSFYWGEDYESGK